MNLGLCKYKSKMETKIDKQEKKAGSKIYQHWEHYCSNNHAVRMNEKVQTQL